jgi:hypothetical protein
MTLNRTNALSMAKKRRLKYPCELCPKRFATPQAKWGQLLLRLTQQDDIAIIRWGGDRSIPGTSESFARSFRLRKRARSSSFAADGQRAVFAQSGPVSRAPA